MASSNLEKKQGKGWYRMMEKTEDAVGTAASSCALNGMVRRRHCCDLPQGVGEVFEGVAVAGGAGVVVMWCIRNAPSAEMWME